MANPDAEWTTAEVAAYLGVGRRAVGPTMARWGVQPLPDARRVGRGWTLVYSAADVIAANHNRPRKPRKENQT